MPPGEEKQFKSPFFSALSLVKDTSKVHNNFFPGDLFTQKIWLIFIGWVVSYLTFSSKVPPVSEDASQGGIFIKAILDHYSFEKFNRR